MLYSLTLAALAAPLASAATLNFTERFGYINYTTLPGYFLQDDPSTNSTTFNYTQENFGLINRTYPATEGLANLTQWQAFEAQVNALNANAPLNTVYKVLFMGRHGEGYHNAAQTYYGTPGWNCYWAEVKGNGTVTWEDAALTSNGILQAQIANRFWKHEFETQKIPYPQSYYTSPLTRCLDTAKITFDGLDLPEYYPFIPTVKELLREGISIHTCDRRSNKTYIHNAYPTYEIEPGFTEFDEIWEGVTAESNSAQNYRALFLLDDVFSHDDHTWISFTSHSGFLASILSVIGHQPFPLATGAVIPVLVKAEFLPAADTPSMSVQPYTTSTWCHNAPPITSISSLDQGCVCSSTTAPLPSLDTQAPFFPGQTSPLNEYTTTTTVVPPGSSTSPTPTTSPAGWNWPPPWWSQWRQPWGPPAPTGW